MPTRHSDPFATARRYDSHTIGRSAQRALRVGGCLLTGGYGSAIGAFFGAIIFGMVLIGLSYTQIDQDWYLVFLGGMLLIAVLFNNMIRKRVTGEH